MSTRGRAKRNPPVALEKKQKSPAKKQKSPEKPGFSEDSSDGRDFSSGSDSDDDRTFVYGGSESESASEYAESKDEAKISGNKGLYYNFHNKNILYKIFASKVSKSFQLAYFIYLHNGKS
jgi:hypothetical protein